MAEFSTRRVDRSRFQLLEQLGSKRKFWFVEDRQRLLFKAEDRGTGDDWAEVVVCHLCRLLGLPHVEYELALECNGSQELGPGVICENMAPDPLQLILGNELLLGRDPQYPAAQRYKVKQHTVDAVTGIVQTLEPPASEWLVDAPAGIESALDVFVGYLMLDAWIANPDRHHGNWAAIWDRSAMRLAPTFDHGAALARNLRDVERKERLTSKDRNRTVAAFAERGRSALFATSADTRPLELRAAFRMVAQRVPAAAQAWLGRLRNVNQQQVWAILERVPAKRMTKMSKQFTAELLRTNRQRLEE